MKLRSSLAKIKMLEMGIIPALTGSELNNMLASLSEEDQRKAKRKFRKAWRKIRKNNPSFNEIMGNDKNKPPTKSEKRNRSVIVVSKIVKSIKV